MSVTRTRGASAANTCAVARPMPLAAPVTRTVRPLTERLSCLKSDMAVMPREKAACVAGLTRLAPIRRQVKRSSNRVQTVANIPGLQIRRLETSDAALYRDIRLEALQKNPEAFGSTFERESAQPLSWFEAAVDRAAIFGAFLDGTLAGIAGYGAQEGSKQAHKALLWGMYVRPGSAKRGSWKTAGRSCSRPCARARGNGSTDCGQRE